MNNQLNFNSSINLNSLTVEEIVNYCYSGVIENLDVETVLRIIESYEKEIDNTRLGDCCEEHDCDEYDNGYKDAIEDVISQIKGML